MVHVAPVSTNILPINVATAIDELLKQLYEDTFSSKAVVQRNNKNIFKIFFACYFTMTVAMLFLLSKKPM